MDNASILVNTSMSISSGILFWERLFLHRHSEDLKRVIHSDNNLLLVRSHSKQVGCFHLGPVNDLTLLWSEHWKGVYKAAILEEHSLTSCDQLL